MACFRVFAFLCALALVSPLDAANANSITGFDISPEGPAVLKTGAQVTVTFGYRITSPRGARIFVRPMQGGQLAPNYGASGSRVFERGDGRARAQFTIRSGETDVDALRFQIVDAATDQVVSEHFERVQFRFNADPLAASATASSCAINTIIGRRVLPEGDVEVSFAGGSKIVYHPDGGFTSIDPDGSSTTALAITMAPIPPPSDSAAPDTAWVSALNDWLDSISTSMLHEIEALAEDPSSFENYRDYEDENAETAYEKLDMRHRFLGLLSR